MTIRKNDIPLLEYDEDPKAVIMPDHERLGVRLPQRAVFAFLGQTVDCYALRHGAQVAASFVSATKDYPVYVLDHGGERVCLAQAPVGASAATQLLDWLVAYGVEKVISTGSCGALMPLAENVFLVPTKALRDEGTSYHYAPPGRYMAVDEQAIRAIEATLQNHGIPYREVITWSTDGFFRETREKVAYRREEGCAVVEMECAALAACAALRGAVWGELLYTGDTLADAERYDERGWGDDSMEYALELSLEAVLRIE